MIDDVHTELSIGLSAEERTELEQLITVLRTDKQADTAEIFAPASEDDLKTLQEQVSRGSEIILNFDARLKSLYDTVCLLYEKSNKMNERINSISEAIAAKII